jgi:hypothetical protein
MKRMKISHPTKECFHTEIVNAANNEYHCKSCHARMPTLKECHFAFEEYKKYSRFPNSKQIARHIAFWLQSVSELPMIYGLTSAIGWEEYSSIIKSLPQTRSFLQTVITDLKETIQPRLPYFALDEKDFNGISEELKQMKSLERFGEKGRFMMMDALYHACDFFLPESFASSSSSLEVWVGENSCDSLHLVSIMVEDLRSKMSTRVRIGNRNVSRIHVYQGYKGLLNWLRSQYQLAIEILPSPLNVLIVSYVM